MEVLSPTLLLCDYILKLDNSKELASYYKRMATMLITVFDHIDPGKSNSLKNFRTDNRFLSFETENALDFIDTKQRDRLESIKGLCAAEGTDLNTIIQEMSSDSVIDSIKVMAKYIKAVHSLPSSWEPNREKLKEDYSQFNQLFSDFTDKFSNISFICSSSSYNTIRETYDEYVLSVLDVIIKWDKNTLDQYIKLTKRLASINIKSEVLDENTVKTIKVLRIIIMAFKLGQERWSTTRNEILSVLYPELIDYTIFNETYIHEIFSLKNQPFAELLLTALIREEAPFAGHELTRRIIYNREEYRSLTEHLWLELKRKH